MLCDAHNLNITYEITQGMAPTHGHQNTYMIHAKETDVGSKALVEPEVVPPRKCNEVTEPLMSQFV